MNWEMCIKLNHILHALIQLMMTSALHLLLIKGFPPDFQVCMPMTGTQQLISSSKSICCCPGIRPNLFKVWKNINKSEKNTVSFFFQWGFILFFFFFCPRRLIFHLQRNGNNADPKIIFCATKALNSITCHDVCSQRSIFAWTEDVLFSHYTQELLKHLKCLRRYFHWEHDDLASFLVCHFIQAMTMTINRKWQLRWKNIIKAGREHYYSYDASLCAEMVALQTQVCNATISLV